MQRLEPTTMEKRLPTRSDMLIQTKPRIISKKKKIVKKKSLLQKIITKLH
jgi:hypothetical protein